MSLDGADIDTSKPAWETISEWADEELSRIRAPSGATNYAVANPFFFFRFGYLYPIPYYTDLSTAVVKMNVTVNGSSNLVVSVPWYIGFNASPSPIYSCATGSSSASALSSLRSNKPFNITDVDNPISSDVRSFFASFTRKLKSLEAAALRPAVHLNEFISSAASGLSAKAQLFMETLQSSMKDIFNRVNSEKERDLMCSKINRSLWLD